MVEKNKGLAHFQIDRANGASLRLSFVDEAGNVIFRSAPLPSRTTAMAAATEIKNQIRRNAIRRHLTRTNSSYFTVTTKGNRAVLVTSVAFSSPDERDSAIEVVRRAGGNAPVFDEA